MCSLRSCALATYKFDREVEHGYGNLQILGSGVAIYLLASYGGANRKRNLWLMVDRLLVIGYEADLTPSGVVSEDDRIFGSRCTATKIGRGQNSLLPVQWNELEYDIHDGSQGLCSPLRRPAPE